MLFTKARLKDVWILDLERRADERGFFARVFCEQEFAAHGMVTHYAQMNTNFSAHRGTLRGLHRQTGVHAEAKLIRCIAGEAFEMLVDLRPDSPTYLEWESFTLNPRDRRLLYAPPGFAHGFLALADDTEITYFASRPYAPGAEEGVRWNDPALGMDWPIPITHISEKDRTWPDLAVSARAPAAALVPQPA
ncbi:MAG: dTDP-4-dehydrorhamnose 3,5-epimerase [Hyphomonadaceae bacterium]|nr:dTDP-4-dehydrorhamnose 3,5-epimerase [Hyphomonadaceae bacterium]